MCANASAPVGAVGEGVFDLEEARTRACRYLALATGGISWAFNLFIPLLTDHVQVVETVFILSLVLMVAAALSWSLARRSVVVAGTCLTVGLAGTIAATVVASPAGQTAYLLALVVLAAAAMAGLRHALLWAAFSTLFVYLAAYRAGLLALNSALLVGGLVWGSAIVSWLGFRPVYLAAVQAWRSYYEALQLSQELRARRGELLQLSKSLGEAYSRLERQNTVLERARAAEEQARRQKAEFAATISHELRTPVNLIIGIAEMLQKPRRTFGGRLPETYHEDIDVIYRNACHISHLIDDILDLSEIDPHRLGLSKQEVRLSEIVEQAVAVVARQFQRKGLYLLIHVPDDLPLVKADPVRLRQVLLNLLSNAARFTDFGGVTISARLEERAIVVSVADTGVGIPASELATVFEEFKQLRPVASDGRRQGSGLGLTISKRLIELHGGNMWVRSEVERGSTFHFSLPRVDSVVAFPVSTDLEVFSRTTAEPGRTLAVLGGDARAFRVIERYLDDYEVVAARGRRQVQHLAQDRRVDALLIIAKDATKPVALTTNTRLGIPVLQCSIHTEQAFARKAGAVAYLVKPVMREQLQAALRRLHRRIRKVLVVEDDPELRQMLVRTIRAGSPHRQVWEAANGKQALLHVQENPPDVVLLDLLMPEMDGYSFVEALRADERMRDVSVIVITAKGNDAEAMVASALTITREDGLAVGELCRVIRGSLNALLASPEQERSAPAPPPTPHA